LFFAERKVFVVAPKSVFSFVGIPNRARETRQRFKAVAMLKKLPVILSQDEVARLIEAASSPFHHTILMTLYGTGVRRAELTNLKITDVDSQRMVVRVQGGKGLKDRDTMLSPNLLTALREH
jgi:integrase/recombinase XerD